MNDPKLLTEAELLKVLNIDVDRTTVWHWRKQGMPHVRIGRSIRYDLANVQAWLRTRAGAGGSWPWSVWTWVAAERKASGEIEPAFWYEECRCRNRIDAENIMRLFRKDNPRISACVGTERPTDQPETDDRQLANYPVHGEG